MGNLDSRARNGSARRFGWALVMIGASIALLGLVITSSVIPSSPELRAHTESIATLMTLVGSSLVVSGCMYLFRIRMPSEKIAVVMVLAGIATGIVWLFVGSGVILIPSYGSYYVAADSLWKFGASICSAYLILALAVYHRSREMASPMNSES